MGFWDGVKALGRANVACADYLHHRHKKGLIAATLITALAILFTYTSNSLSILIHSVKQN